MPITIEQLAVVLNEADRFSARAKTCLKDLRDADMKDQHGLRERWPDTRLSAAVRRSSMDLTRALAALRKP